MVQIQSCRHQSTINSLQHQVGVDRDCVNKYYLMFASRGYICGVLFLCFCALSMLLFCSYSKLHQNLGKYNIIPLSLRCYL